MLRVDTDQHVNRLTRRQRQLRLTRGARPSRRRDPSSSPRRRGEGERAGRHGSDGWDILLPWVRDLQLRGRARRQPFADIEMRRDHIAKQRLSRIVLRAGGKEGRGGRSRVKSSIFKYTPACTIWTLTSRRSKLLV